MFSAAFWWDASSTLPYCGALLPSDSSRTSRVPYVCTVPTITGGRGSLLGSWSPAWMLGWYCGFVCVRVCEWVSASVPSGGGLVAAATGSGMTSQMVKNHPRPTGSMGQSLAQSQAHWALHGHRREMVGRRFCCLFCRSWPRTGRESHFRRWKGRNRRKL